ncbi:MAG TPA: hypothetical protein VE685_20090 [Thermoanaerobaculia bacterium]|nr:hypothetical protein [Thermoanaerobaculia bacterium]
MLPRTGRLARLAPPLVLLAAVLVFYGRALDRPFTSEDFLLIRFLGENPPWRDLREQLASPWLGISVVRFYRPISTLLYGAEIAAFGSQPAGYNVAHLLVHLGSAALLWAIVRRLAGPDGDLTSFAAALLFALHPLHPNAVVFSASFATLFGALFLLAAMLAYQRFREGGALGAWGASMALFLLALGSYEAAAVLPGLLAAYDHLAGVRRASWRRHASLALGYLPFFGVLGGYLLFRRSLFGESIGGYEEYRNLLLAPQLRRVLHDVAASIHQLHLPVYDRPQAPWVLAISCAVLVGAPLAFWLLRRRSLDSSHARLWLFSWVWIVASLAPFAFKPSVPGNGRYWYLAAAGVAMSVGFVARGACAATRPPWRRLAPAAAVLLVACWGVLLAESVDAYVAAGRTARTIQGELVRGGRTSPSPAFLTRYPYFLENQAQVPVAQVYHYGVWDSVHPPFVPVRVPVRPLPPLAGAELLPVALGAPGSTIWEWDGKAGMLRRFIPGSGERPAEFRALHPGDGAVVDPARDFAEVAVPPGRHARFRLLVASRINGAAFDLDPASVRNGVLRADLPDEMLTTSDRLYGGGEHYWWIEAKDAEGRVSGFSRMRSFRLD